MPDGRLILTIEAGLSNRNADVDNVLKPFIDVLQKKYHFNDRMIYEMRIKKTIVKRGQEYLKWCIYEAD